MEPLANKQKKKAFINVCSFGEDGNTNNEPRSFRENQSTAIMINEPSSNQSRK